MARLNIEHRWWSDNRRSRLIELTGSRFLADGLAVNLWRISQDASGRPFENNRQFPPEHLAMLCDAGLATIDNGKISVTGAAENHAWIAKRRESARIGGIARAAQLRKKRLVSKTQANASQTLELEAPRTADISLFQTPRLVQSVSEFQPNAEKTQRLASKRLPSLRFKEEEDLAALDLLDPENKNKGTLAALGSMALPAQVKNPIGFLIGRYRKAFQERYPGAQPDLRGKVQGQMKTLLKDYPLERAVQLIEGYLQMDGRNEWFKIKGHDFTTFIENLNPISIALAQGQENNGSIDWDKIFAAQPGGASSASQ